jgi:vancomycin resistance protein YoaR
MPGSHSKVDKNQDSDKEVKPERQLPWRFIVPIGVVGLAIAVVVGFELIYVGRALPGVTADGVKISGMTKAEATLAIQKQTQVYSTKTVVLHYGTTSVNIPVASLGLNYNSVQSAQTSLDFGRSGSLWSQFHAQLRSFFGRSTPVAVYTYNQAALANYVGAAANAVDTAVSNASLGVSGTQVSVLPAAQGQRLDLGLVVDQLNDRLANTSTATVTVSSYALAPAVETAGLVAVKGEAGKYLAAPLTVSYAGHTKTIPLTTIASWLTVTSQPIKSNGLPTYLALRPHVTVTLNPTPIAAYVSNLAAAVNQPAVNATITITNGQPTAAIPAQNGQQLDQAASVTAITTALSKPDASHSVTLAVATVKPAVSSDNLASLGITGLLSEGETTFAGSGYSRDTNVRVAASKFNNVLIAPGATFSFGAILGAVGPEQGYLPGYVILGNHEELQYGGGICQVGTTAFRAALLAGLPITERFAHSFAVPYYTAPYGVPGVDATIYYPQDDLKFTNDTPGYILIQTIMSGEDLKFDFYGTKTKSGVIRGPYFVSGTSDATKASHTVFYRDILNNAGQVTSTDTFNSYYAPSTDFPIEPGVILD